MARHPVRDLWQRFGLEVINGMAALALRRSAVVPYGPHPRQQIDVYGSLAASRRPLMVFFYGGNWSSGARRDYRFVADAFAAFGCDVAIPDYRLYPEVRFDAIQADSVTALETLLAEVPVGRKVFLGGHSAGAQLAVLMGLDASLTPVSDRISGVVGLAGPYDFFPFKESRHADLFGPPPAWPRSQAINYVRHDGPPLLLLHGEDDTRVKVRHSKGLAERLVAAGGLADLRVYPNTGHVDIILSLAALFRRRTQVSRDVAAFLTLHGR